MTSRTFASACWVILFVIALVKVTSGNTQAKINKVKSPSTVHAIAGQRVTLYCYYSGYPKPQAMWMRQGKLMDKKCKHCVTKIDNATPGVAKLYVTPYRGKDFGKYVCKARNKNGFDTIQIDVVEKPSEETQCHKDVILGKDPRLKLEFRPKCNPDGSYHRVQCSVHLRKCWCVDQQTGHKVADAYKAHGGMHCTAPKDISTVSIVVVSVGVVLMLVILDIMVFACCKRGFMHAIVRCKGKNTMYGKLKEKEYRMRRLSQIDEVSEEEYDTTDSDTERGRR